MRRDGAGEAHWTPDLTGVLARSVGLSRATDILFVFANNLRYRSEMLTLQLLFHLKLPSPQSKTNRSKLEYRLSNSILIKSHHQYQNSVVTSLKSH